MEGNGWEKMGVQEKAPLHLANDSSLGGRIQEGDILDMAIGPSWESLARSPPCVSLDPETRVVSASPPSTS